MPLNSKNERVSRKDLRKRKKIESAAAALWNVQRWSSAWTSRSEANRTTKGRQVRSRNGRESCSAAYRCLENWWSRTCRWRSTWWVWECSKWRQWTERTVLRSSKRRYCWCKWRCGQFKWNRTLPRRDAFSWLREIIPAIFAAKLVSR